MSGLGPQATSLLAGAAEQLALDTVDVDDEFPVGTTVQEARAHLRSLLSDGHHCPVCGQFAKEYKRKLNATMVKALSVIYKEMAPGLHYVHGPTVLRGTGIMGGEVGKLALFDLVEEKPGKPFGGSRSGHWRVTPKGRAFLQGVLAVPKYAHVYDGRVLGFSGPSIDVSQVAPTFDFKELMKS